ncbi:HD domain-containing protein [Streptomyces sp. NPDC005526]|uniref:HD domain-containing protein n=1 Tax=Streptomyces sp. NPDC005526 TaxID=3156885 RepID=UPI0033BB2896
MTDTRPPLTPAEVEAVARAAHEGQVDKAGRPYAEHLRAVAEGVRARGGDPDQVAAAWLHDSVEDGALSARGLQEAALSRRTKDIVLAVTKRAGEEPEAYARRILATPGARLVKEADLAHNADPRRLAVLDDSTRKRLTEKYARMRALLGLTDEGDEGGEGDEAGRGRPGEPGESGNPGGGDGV